jgi:RNA polymerase sigma factor (sigma-70 family)
LAEQDLTETSLSIAYTDDGMEKADNEVALYRAMRQLTDYEQQLISMRNEQQMDISDIAEITGTSKRSVSTMINRAKNKLIKIIRKGDDDNGQY